MKVVSWLALRQGDRPGGPVQSRGCLAKWGREAEGHPRCKRGPALKMEGGLRAEDAGTSGSWKGQGTVLPWSLQRDQPYRHSGFSLLRPILDSGLQNCETIN